MLSHVRRRPRLARPGTPSANKDLERKDRRAAFIDAMTEKYTEGIQREDVKEAAIDQKVKKMEDENKANFECAEIDDIFVGC